MAVAKRWTGVALKGLILGAVGIVVCLGLLVGCTATHTDAPRAVHAPIGPYVIDRPIHDTVILSSADDPYYPLAEEISAAEGISIYPTLEQAAEARPVYLLWVIAPKNLSEDVLMDFGRNLGNLESSISVGIISGKTAEDARGLWKGSSRITNSDFAIINGTKENKIEPEIIRHTGTQATRIELTIENLLAVLEGAGMLQISLEGAASSWFDQHLGITVKYSDIPSLNSCVIQHYGCSTFRPWTEHSIALECISQGAIAYCGFVFPSVAGTRFGDYTDNSVLYTWDRFPLGHLVQIQNHAAMQSYAGAPHYFLLGDPRIYSSSEAPYEVISDETEGDRRTIKLSGVKRGLIPIYIQDGSRYDHVSVLGLSSSSMASSHFNSRLQMININNDKYVVVKNESDAVTIEMNTRARVFQALSGEIVSFLDSTIVANQGSSMPMLLAVPVLMLFTIGVVRKRYTSRELIAGLVPGAAVAVAALCYVLMRMDHIVVTNLPVSVNWFFILSIFVFVGYGGLQWARAKELKGKAIAVLTANLYSLFVLSLFAGATAASLVLFGETAGINRPGYPWLLPLMELIAGCVFCCALYLVLEHCYHSAHG